MTLDDGVLGVYKVVNAQADGNMPGERLSLLSRFYYGERVVGFSRQYAAMGANERVDLLLRIWNAPQVRAGMYVIPEAGPYAGEQYRIDNVQHVTDDLDGLRYTDLTLYRLEELLNVEV